ncbi:unnamed protein product [Hanseniaspora opuntiae]
MPFEYIAVDLMIASREGEFKQTSDCKAMLVMVDLKSKYKLCEILPDKKSDTVTSVLIDMIRLVETQFDAKVKVIISDQGKEFKNENFNDFLAETGKCNVNPNLGDSRGNNMAENAILVIKKLTRKMMNENIMITSDMWPYAARYGTMLSNYISSAQKDKVSANDLLGMQPIKINELYEFGLPCMINQRSNDPKRNHVCGYFMGYDTFRSYISYFFVPGNDEDEIDRMVISSSFSPIENFQRGEKYVLNLNEKYINDPIAKAFAHDVNKEQPKPTIEEAGLMNKVNHNNEMKVLSGNEWKRQHEREVNNDQQSKENVIEKESIENMEKTKKMSTNDNIVEHSNTGNNEHNGKINHHNENDLLSRKPKIYTGGIKRKLDNKYNDDNELKMSPRYEAPSLKYKINGQELTWNNKMTGKNVKTNKHKKFKKFISVNLDEVLENNEDVLNVIEETSNLLNNEKLITSVDELNEKVINNENDYYNVDSLLNNEDYENKLDLVGRLLKSPQKMKNVFYNVNDNEAFKEPFENELGKLKSTGTIKTTENVEHLPDDAMVVELLTLFTRKRDDSIKARVFARGNVLKDKYGNIIEDNMKIDDVFMTTLRESIIAHLNFVLMKGHHCAQIDISNAYLNGELPFDVYIKNPERKGYLKLNKALYGLSISGRIWFAMINLILKSLGCDNKAEGIYYHQEKQVYVMLYVDDLLITGLDKSKLDELINEINNIFELKRSECCIDGKDNYKFDYVGVQIEYQRLNHMKIKCEFREKLEVLQFGSNKNVNLPGDPNFKVPNNLENGEKVDPKVLNYAQKVIGLTQYVTSFRPDVAYYVNMLSVAIGRKKIYRSVLKQLMILGEYFYNTRDDYIKWKYHKNVDDDLEIVCYCDASLGINSRSGYFIYVNGNPMIWKSQKIKTVCTSSAEAEMNAIYNACLPVLFMKSWYKHNYGMNVKVKMLTDATAILDGLYRNSSYMNEIGGNWYAIKSKKIIEFVRAENIDLEKIDTRINVADILTKATKREQFNRLKMFIMKTNSSIEY